MLRPIWDAFSSKKYAEKAFYERKSPNQGTKMGSEIAPRPGQCGTTAKMSERQQAGHKTRGPGGLPPALFLPISREQWGPPPGRRGPRGAAPRGLVRAWTTRRVRSTAPLPRPGPGGRGPTGAAHPKGTQHRAAPGRWSGFRPAQGPAGMAGRNLSRKCPRRPPRWEGRLGQ